jgi:hypothetical protein
MSRYVSLCQETPNLNFGSASIPPAAIECLMMMQLPSLNDLRDV